MGNRGRLHDKNGKVKWFQQSKHWLICELEYKNIKRKLLQPNSYTELFFLDEATALAAGHRPCNTCRRESAQQFLKLSGFKTLSLLDDQLHSERMVSGPIVTDWTALPLGAMIGWLSYAYLVHNNQLFSWSFDGYEPVDSIESDLESKGIIKHLQTIDPSITFNSEPLRLCNPPTTIKVLENGYVPQIALKK